MRADASLCNSSLNQKLSKVLQSKMPIKDAPKLRDAVNFDESSIVPVHRWFRYREGFSPAILDRLNGYKRVFDPFCGCGTSLIEAKQRGKNAIGMDVNPLAIFVAKVKTRDYRACDTNDLASWALQSAKSTKLWPIPKMPLLPKLFQSEALNELLKLREGLESCKNKKIRDLLFLCWLNILEPCSNVFKEGNGLKYRNKKRQPGKYSTVPDETWIPRYFGSSIQSFVRKCWLEQCHAVSTDLKHLLGRNLTKIEVLERSCLDSTLSNDIQSCDSSVFSPPYANRFDYFETFKIELWMGNFVSSSEEMRRLRNRSMRNNLSVQTGVVKKREYIEEYLNLMDEKASSVRMGIRETIRGYFEDVSLLARNLHEVIEPHGKVLCVVGNSAYAGVLIPTDLLCSVIFEEEGFTVESIEIARHLHVSSQQRSKMVTGLAPYMRESLITCIR